MKDWKIFLVLTCLLISILGTDQSVDAQQNLAQETYAIFERHCLNCHGRFGAYADEYVMDYATLIETQTVVPGNPDASELYLRLLGDTAGGVRMPFGKPPLAPEMITMVRSWIEAGAPDWDAFPKPEGDFITTDEMIKTFTRI